MSTTHLPPFPLDLVRDPAQTRTRVQQGKAREAAEEFEATMFSQVFEKMEKSLSITGEENDDPGHDSMAALGTRAVAQALAHRHVLGIADMIERSLHVSNTQSSTSGVTSNSVKPTTPTADGDKVAARH